MDAEETRREMLNGITAQRNALLKDIRETLVFHPNRTLDIYSFMQAYLREAGRDNWEDEKEEILRHLIDCTEGRDYPDPRAGTYAYTEEDIQRLETAIDRCIETATHGSANELDEADLALCDILADFTEDPNNGLLDTWRREEIYLLREACRDYMSLRTEQEHAQSADLSSDPTIDWGY